MCFVVQVIISVALVVYNHWISTRKGVQWVWFLTIGGHIDKVRGYSTPLKWHSENSGVCVCVLCTCTCAFIDSVDINWWKEKNLLLLSQYSNHCSMHSLCGRVSLIPGLLATPYQSSWHPWLPLTACYKFLCRCFEVYPDPVMQEVTHFCLPGLLPILKNTVQFVSEVRHIWAVHVHVHVVRVQSLWFQKHRLLQCHTAYTLLLRLSTLSLP